MLAKAFSPENKSKSFLIIVAALGYFVDIFDLLIFSIVREPSLKALNVPEGYARYEEKRKGREIAGHKLSNWIYKEDADFCRKYTSRNPREDFADSFAHGVFGLWDRFKGETGKKKIEIIKKILKKVD